MYFTQVCECCCVVFRFVSEFDVFCFICGWIFAAGWPLSGATQRTDTAKLAHPCISANTKNH